MRHVREKPPYTCISATTCFSPVLSASMDIQKDFPNQLCDPPHQLAAPFSNKTASFYILLKIVVSLKPEDAVTHVISKRKKGYFFNLSFGRKAAVLPQHWPGSSLLLLGLHGCVASRAALTSLPLLQQPGNYLRCRCHVPVPAASWLWREGAQSLPQLKINP